MNLNCNSVHLYYHIKNKMADGEWNIGLLDFLNNRFYDLRNTELSLKGSDILDSRGIYFLIRIKYRFESSETEKSEKGDNLDGKSVQNSRDSSGKQVDSLGTNEELRVNLSTSKRKALERFKTRLDSKFA